MGWSRLGKGTPHGRPRASVTLAALAARKTRKSKTGRRASSAEAAFGRPGQAPGRLRCPRVPSGQKQRQSSAVGFLVEIALEREATASRWCKGGWWALGPEPVSAESHADRFASETRGFRGRTLEPGRRTSSGRRAPPLSLHPSLLRLSSALRGPFCTVGSGRPSQGIALSLAPLGLLEAVPPFLAPHRGQARVASVVGHVNTGAAPEGSRNPPKSTRLAGKETGCPFGTWKFGLYQGTGEQI